MHTFTQRSLLCLCCFVFAACANPITDQRTGDTLRPIPTLRPTVAAAPAPNNQSNTPDSGWIIGESGVELRKLRIELGDRRADLSIVRLDPAQIRLRVGYAPDNPQTLDSWSKIGAPSVVVNGGFFDERNRTTALVVSDNVASGETYQGFGGMFTVSSNGDINIQALRDQPYDPAQSPSQAIQSFPMLVFPGGLDSGIQWDGERDRRTALALDRTGRLLVIACPQPSFSLNELATWLQQSDLDIDRALNLDGGASTGLYVNSGAAQELIEPFSKLPIVLFAEAK